MAIPPAAARLKMSSIHPNHSIFPEHANRYQHKQGSGQTEVRQVSSPMMRPSADESSR
ncbi:MAG: hypothetical protein U0Z26_18205 [Anaerolineales bacterium]